MAHLTVQCAADGVALYGKYVGNWGGEATRWRFDAVQDGNVVRSVTLCPSAKLHLEVKVSRTALREKDTCLLYTSDAADD